MADEEVPKDEQEPVIISVPGITNLACTAIQLHELYLELKSSGFTQSEAITLAGMVLSNSAAVERMDGYEIDIEEEELELPLEDDDGDDDDRNDLDEDEDGFGNWDEFLENPEGDEKI